jgi:DNA modification methylase
VLPTRQWKNRIVGHGEEDADQLLANPRNWRIHPKAQQDVLKGVLAQIGWVQDVIVNQRTGFVVDGHARVALAISAGERVPVVYVDLSDEEEAAILATLDPISAMAGKDEAIFGELTAGMNEAFKALVDATAPPVTNCAPVAGEDDVPDVPIAPVTVLGDLWLLGEHRVLCGDSTSVDAVARLCGATLADMVWTDPPYGVSYVGKTKDALTIENDALDDAGLEELLRGSLGCALVACRAGAAWYVAAPPGPLHHIFSTVLKEMEVWHQTLNWVKSVFVMGRSDYHYRHEPIFYGWKPGAAHYFVDDRTQDTVLEVAKPSRSTEHPTMKPVELIERCISNSSKPGELVLDPFLGSGTSVIACEKTGRICYGMELAPEYVDVIVKRWQEFTGKEAKLGGGPYKHSTFEKAKAGRLKAAEDAIVEDAICAVG